jgi:hypothetical protein
MGEYYSGDEIPFVIGIVIIQIALALNLLAPGNSP